MPADGLPPSAVIETHDVPSLYPSQICRVFLTHLHSDHTLDYAELAFKLWWRRPNRLRAFGPAGPTAMTQSLYAMMAADTLLRTTGPQPVADLDLYRVDVTEIGDGFVFEETVLDEVRAVYDGEVVLADDLDLL